MEELQEKITRAMQDGDYSRAMSLQDQYQNIIKIYNQKNILKSLAKSSLTERKENLNYIWLTVNPNAECSLDTFLILVNKMILKKWMKSYIYVIEQRGTSEETLGRGFHLHCIIKKPDDKCTSHCIREISNTFKKVCDVSNFHCFNTKQIDDEEYIRKLKYILAEKESTLENNKALKQQYDKIFRRRMNLREYYFSNIDIGDYALLPP